MHSCMPWLNSISRKDETPQLSLGSGGATVCFQQELVSWSKERTRKAWHHTSEVALGTVAGGREFEALTNLLKINRQCNLYCCDSAAVKKTLADMPRQGEHTTKKVCSVLALHVKTKNGQQAQHLVDRTFWPRFVPTGLTYEGHYWALITHKATRAAAASPLDRNCTMPRYGPQAMHADGASSNVEQHFKAVHTIY